MRTESVEIKEQFDDTEEIPVDRRVRALVMRAAQLRKDAKGASRALRTVLLREADELEEHALRMTFDA